ncbi:MAG: CRISPR system precrRNA processing endoribonuclease RAMP protein Cas6 [Fretibacterium sp.]|nr:CRISPR system precrRNA processing endoribonuclease RAMP protein Cas6 [Fretibacterium sp.]
MFGIAILRLRAEKDAVLPRVHGRLMHGAFFSLLREVDSGLSGAIHANSGLKPFTVSELSICEDIEKGKARSAGGRVRGRDAVRHVKAGSVLERRVTALTEPMVQAVKSFPHGVRFQAGELPLCIEEIIMDGRRKKGTGVIEPEKLLPANDCSTLRQITFHFRSPVSFRRDKDDFPVPTPGLIFASLSDKWQGAGLSPLAGKSVIQEDAAGLLPTQWQGRTVRHFLSADRGVLAFLGSFTYELAQLQGGARQSFVALARFAPYSGVGRLCAQGLGQTEVEIE